MGALSKQAPSAVCPQYALMPMMQPCGYCEGVRLTFDGEAVVDVETLRAAQPR